MAITSSDIQNQSFSIDRKGYDVDEVDVFLEHVASEIDEMNSTIQELEKDLDSDKFSGFDTPAHAVDGNDEILAEKDAIIADLEHQLEEKKADDIAVAQALIIAQRSADDIITTAREDAAQIRQDAEDEAQRILDKANAEKQRILGEIKDLEDDREELRDDYSDLLNDFIDSATKKLEDIAPVKAAVSSAHAKAGAGYSGKNQAPIRRNVSAAVATYTTPQTVSSVVVPTTPKPSQVEKDFSGFGDVDTAFEMEDID